MPTTPLVLRLLTSNELEDGAILVARGMRDNPANMRVFRISDRAQRSRMMGRFFTPVLRSLYRRGLVLGAVRSNLLVGICGMARPGFCQPGTIEKIRILPAAVIGNPIPTPLRLLSWVGEWARRDPLEPHWHLGPVAVEPELQGCGIGTAMLHTFCAVVDSTGANAYLETDKSENIRLYQRFGFTVKESAEVLGVPNWFMFRTANAKAKTKSSIATEASESPAHLRRIQYRQERLVTKSRLTGMPDAPVNPESVYRDQWLALLEKNGVRRPTDLTVIAVLGIVVQLTRGEPSGSLELEESPGSVLMVNLSPVQALRQVRNQRLFVSNMLNWDMTLMPRGTRSKWSWNSTCDRFDVILSPDVLGEEHPIDTVDRFLFRDAKLKSLCQQLSREIILRDRADRLQIEMLAIELAQVFFRDYSTAPERTRGIPIGGLTRNNAKRVLEYAEANLGRGLTLRELAGVAQLSTHHFIRMFKKTLGVTPHQYLLERRVERAKDLLRGKPASLAEVALSSGFGSQSHFTSTFHRAVGATPAEFQRLAGEPI